MDRLHELHPDFFRSNIWWGDPQVDHADATSEGGDIMPMGDGTVLMGMSERTSRRVITQVAAAQFPAGAATSVAVTGMPKRRFAAVVGDAEL